MKITNIPPKERGGESREALQFNERGSYASYAKWCKGRP